MNHDLQPTGARRAAKALGELTAAGLVAALLGACGGGGSGYAQRDGAQAALSVIVSGLSSPGLVLKNGDAQTLSIGRDGTFTFSQPVAANGRYAITVGTQPAGQVCTVANGTSTGVTGSIAPIAVSCSALTYPVAGAVSGLGADARVTLLNNGADALVVAADGRFAFATPVAYNGGYAITVGRQPTGQVCTVSQGVGDGVTKAVSNIAVACSATTFPIGGAATGLRAGAQVTLLNNGADPLVVEADGAFTFATPVAYDGGYAVTVASQPAGQVCSVGRGVGAGVTKAVSNVAVSCSTTTYTVSGTVSGLGGGLQVTLHDNGGDARVVSANGSFSFATPVAYDGSYSVTVNQQPAGQTCSVANASGSAVKANVSNVAVTCSTNGFTIGGTVSGLDPGQQATLFNNGGDALVVAANGSFTFATPVAAGGSYAVKVSTQPTAQTCIASLSSGSALAADVTGVSVACSASADALALLKLSQFQLADAQWDVGACTTTTTCTIFSNTPGTAYVTPFTNGTFDWAGCGAGCYLSFTPNIVGGLRDATNPWSEDLYRADGTVYQAGGSGDFAILGNDPSGNFYLFYVGSDNNTGTLVTANSILSGAGFSFTGTSQPTVTEVNQALAGM